MPILLFRVLSVGLLLAGSIAYASPPAATPLPSTTVSLGGQVFDVEVTHTRKQRAQGMMFRPSMPLDHGMLFLFPQPRQMAFWMKNMEIPLDILFFDQQSRLIRAHVNVPPCRESPCPHYASGGTTAMVLELNGGRSTSLSLTSGSRLHIHQRDKLPAPE